MMQCTFHAASFRGVATQTKLLLLSQCGPSMAILHLDGDLYESIKAPLNNLWQKVVIGGLIVIDDFSVKETADESFPGARTAIKEFMRDNDFFDYLTSMRGTPYLKRVK